MKKSLIAGLAAVAFATVSACSGLSGFSEKHAGVEFADVYAQAETFETKAYVTIRLYEATVDAAIFACDEEVNPEAAGRRMRSASKPLRRPQLSPLV